MVGVMGEDNGAVDGLGSPENGAVKQDPESEARQAHGRLRVKLRAGQPFHDVDRYNPRL